MHKIEETREMLAHLTMMKYSTAPVVDFALAIDKLIAYIEEDLPTRPTQYKSHPEDIYMCRCGSTFIVSPLGVKMNFCPVCGVRQDWRDEDER